MALLDQQTRDDGLTVAIPKHDQPREVFWLYAHKFKGEVEDKFSNLEKHVNANTELAYDAHTIAKDTRDAHGHLVNGVKVIATATGYNPEGKIGSGNIISLSSEIDQNATEWTTENPAYFQSIRENHDYVLAQHRT